MVELCCRRCFACLIVDYVGPVRRRAIVVFFPHLTVRDRDHHVPVLLVGSLGAGQCWHSRAEVPARSFRMPTIEDARSRQNEQSDGSMP